MEPSLATLLAPLTTAEFVEQFWQRRYVASHGSLDRFGDVLAPTLARTIEELVARARDGMVAAWFADPAGAHREASMPRQAGLTLYHGGLATLYFAYAAPEIVAWVQRIEHELGRRPDSGIVSIFASRAGEGTKAHFDANENFTIQLRGIKRWRVSLDRRIDRPGGNWVEGKSVIEPWLCEAAPDGLPRGMPEHAEPIELRPGTMLYVPAGCWHETETVADSWSLNLNLTGTATAWTEVIAPVMRELMKTERDLRAAAAGAWTPAGRTRAVHERLDHALARARAQLARVTARDLWGPPSDEPTPDELDPGLRLRRNPLGYVFVSAAEGERWSVRIGRYGADDRLVADLVDEMVTLLRWLRERDGSFTVAEALAIVPDDDADDASELLQALVALGYLTPA